MMLHRGKRSCGHSPKKNPTLLRVHNILKKVHPGPNSFPLYLEWHSKATHSICFCSCGKEDNVSQTLRSDITDSASHLLLRTTNSMTVTGFAEQPNNTRFSHLNDSVYSSCCQNQKHRAGQISIHSPYPTWRSSSPSQTWRTLFYRG